MDVATVATQVMPYVAAAIGAYGTAVWTKAQDAAADETVSLGRRLLQRLAGTGESRSRLEAAVADVAEAPEDEDFHAALRGQVKKALIAEPDLADEIVAMLSASRSITGSGSQIVSGSHIGGDSIQIGNARDVDIRRG